MMLEMSITDLGKLTKTALPVIAAFLLPAVVGAEEVPLADAIDADEWTRVENSVNRALATMAEGAKFNGSIGNGKPTGQPAITALAVTAFISCGHTPGHGEYGKFLHDAVDYVLRTQGSHGLFSEVPIGRFHQSTASSHTVTYNHAIAGMMLCEVYGLVGEPQSSRVKEAITKAILATYQFQDIQKSSPADQGGIRYIHPMSRSRRTSDLSVTAWHLMFLRSAANAGFPVPEEPIRELVGYIERCYVGDGQFSYEIGRPGKANAAMTGAGAFSLSLAGQHQNPKVLEACRWIADNPYSRDFTEIAGVPRRPSGRPFYTAYYTSQAMAQVGGELWARYYPDLVQTLLMSQTKSGSWPHSNSDQIFGNTYTTALAVLALTPPYQILPIYQR